MGTGMLAESNGSTTAEKRGEPAQGLTELSLSVAAGVRDGSTRGGGPAFFHQVCSELSSSSQVWRKT